MNWSVLNYGSVVIFALIYYAVTKRHEFVGFVAYVRKDDVEIDLTDMSREA